MILMFRFVNENIEVHKKRHCICSAARFCRELPCNKDVSTGCSKEANRIEFTADYIFDGKMESSVENGHVNLVDVQ